MSAASSLNVVSNRVCPAWRVVALGAVLCGLSACQANESAPAAEPERAARKSDAPAKTERTARGRDGEDWPVFLGPHGTGVSNETGLLETWPQDGPPLLWERKVGTGYSAPSIRGNRLVLHHRIADDEVIECLRADNGETLWKQGYPSTFSDPYGYNNGPRCTPLLTDDRCYTYGAEGMLTCLDLATGKKIWSRDCKAEFQLPDWFFGVGCTPILEGDLLIVLVGGQPNSGVVAFDADTGKTVWQNVGRDTWDGVETGWRQEPVYKWTGEEQIASYSSPIAVTIHGKRHLLCLGRQGLVSLDPQSGDVNFKYWFMSRAFESVNAARPVVVGDLVFLTAAYRVGSALLRVGKDGTSCEEVYRNEDNLQAHWSTPIHVDGHIYGFSGRHEQEGSFRCLDLKTGKIEWETSGFGGKLEELAQDPRTGQIVNRETGEAMPWPFFGRGSKILADGKFIVLGERGTLALVKIDSEKFEEIARTSYEQISYPAWTAPVLSRKRLYLRDEDALICLDLAPRNGNESKDAGGR